MGQREAEGKEVRELVAIATAALAQLRAHEASLRVTLEQASDLQALLAALQKEAADLEFEATVPAALRTFVDGSLLQRIGFAASRTTTLVATARPLAQGLRDLTADCERTVALASTETLASRGESP